MVDKRVMRMISLGAMYIVHLCNFLPSFQINFIASKDLATAKADTVAILQNTSFHFEIVKSSYVFIWCFRLINPDGPLNTWSLNSDRAVYYSV